MLISLSTIDTHPTRHAHLIYGTVFYINDETILTLGFI